MKSYDDLIIGSGHNGLVAACYLALAGRSVCIVEASDTIGGAAISARIFPGVDARISKYSYLISLFPRKIIRELDVSLTTIERRISSYTPDPETPARGLKITANHPAAVHSAISRFTGSTADAEAWLNFYDRISTVAGTLFETLTEPLLDCDQFRALVPDPALWQDLFERPLGELIEQSFHSDVLRGIALTDALIGTFASARSPSLLQNICFLYHVIGNGTGAWDVPAGGMGALTSALANRARQLGVEILSSTPATHITSDGSTAKTTCTIGSSSIDLHSQNVLANCAPAILRKLLGQPPQDIAPPAAGSQIKVNMILKRLPKLRDPDIEPADAFSGTFHINESYSQLETAYLTANSGLFPNPLPLEIYCHSLTDPSILGPQLRAAGAQTLTVFALHAPHHLVSSDPENSRLLAQNAVLASLNSVLAQPIEDCLWIDAHGNPCIEVNTTADIASALKIPTGNIFHTPLDWPFAMHPGEVGTWGVATEIPNIILCGSGARRGGGVSGIPGHNAARHILENLSRPDARPAKHPSPR